MCNVWSDPTTCNLVVKIIHMININWFNTYQHYIKGLVKSSSLLYFPSQKKKKKPPRLLLALL